MYRAAAVLLLIVFSFLNFGCDPSITPEEAKVLVVLDEIQRGVESNIDFNEFEQGLKTAKAEIKSLERNNKKNQITNWLEYFAHMVLVAQDNTMKRVDFYIAKAKLYERLRDKLNERQEKAVARIFREGIDGFKGGLSADNYMSITRASRATTTRDLRDLVEKGALIKTGELRHTRYYLNLSARE